MKLLISTSSPEAKSRLTEYLAEHNHVIVDWIDQTDYLFYLIAQKTPHLVIVEPNEKFLTHVDRLCNLYPDVRFFLLDLQHEETWKEELNSKLRQPPLFPCPRPYTDGPRMVVHDRTLESLASGPLRRPNQTANWEKLCQTQEAQFLLMLEAARKNHPAAKHYYSCLKAQQAGLDEELAYRFCHGSYKGLSWSRDLALKWLGLLAHYVVDVELQYLPLPCSPAPQVDFVHHEPPIEGLYALALLCSCHLQPSIRQALSLLLSSKFTNQFEPALLNLSLRLYGQAKFLEQVAKAQIEYMDHWINPETVSKSLESFEKLRNLGILRDFWNLSFILQAPEPLQSIVQGFHSGKTYVQHQRIFPTYIEFRRSVIKALQLENPKSG